MATYIINVLSALTVIIIVAVFRTIRSKAKQLKPLTSRTKIMIRFYVSAPLGIFLIATGAAQPFNEQLINWFLCLAGGWVIGTLSFVFTQLLSYLPPDSEKIKDNEAQ